MKYCRECGEPLSDNMKFCTKCGTPCRIEFSDRDMSLAANAQTVTEAKRKFNTKPKLIVGIIVVVIAILLLISFIMPLTSNKIVGKWELYAVKQNNGWVSRDTVDYGQSIENMGFHLAFEKNGDFTLSAYGVKNFGTWEKEKSSDESRSLSYTLSRGDEEQATVYFKNKDYSHLYYETDYQEMIFTREDSE